MEDGTTREVTQYFRQIADAAKANPQVAEQVREILAESGLLEVFGAGEQVDVVDLLDVGGEAALRARLGELPIGTLRQIIAARTYDPEKESARWRTNKLIDLIVAHAQQELAAEQEAAAKAQAPGSWML